MSHKKQRIFSLKILEHQYSKHKANRYEPHRSISKTLGFHWLWCIRFAAFCINIDQIVQVHRPVIKVDEIDGDREDQINEEGDSVANCKEELISLAEDEADYLIEQLAQFVFVDDKNW